MGRLVRRTAAVSACLVVTATPGIAVAGLDGSDLESISWAIKGGFKANRDRMGETIVSEIRLTSS